MSVSNFEIALRERNCEIAAKRMMLGEVLRSAAQCNDVIKVRAAIRMGAYVDECHGFFLNIFPGQHLFGVRQKGHSQNDAN